MKLPNAPEDTGLGTDETDVLGLLYLAWSGERWRLQAGGGLAILGSPVQHAAQDDAALVHARGALMLGPTWLSAGLDGRLASPRNPLDLSLDVGASWTRGRLQLGVEGLAGLSPAAALMARSETAARPRSANSASAAFSSRSRELERAMTRTLTYQMVVSTDKLTAAIDLGGPEAPQDDFDFGRT